MVSPIVFRVSRLGRLEHVPFKQSHFVSSSPRKRLGVYKSRFWVRNQQRTGSRDSFWNPKACCGEIFGMVSTPFSRCVHSLALSRGRRGKIFCLKRNILKHRRRFGEPRFDALEQFLEFQLAQEREKLLPRQ